MDYISVETVKKMMEKYGYICDDESLLWEAVSIVNSLAGTGGDRKGQDISAICLAGPPGSGKTEFAKVIYKIVRDIVAPDCVIVSYQCDPTTGKENLFEDINVTAVVQSDASKVIVEGALLKAIKAVNEGKKVILFLDEYDKAREETDSFILQFLQSGEISTGQTDSEDARIKDPANKKNLQVILCKNDNREKLSGPLERRLEFIYLKEMRPHVFHTVASRAYPDDQKLVDFVALVYDIMYDSKENFERLPSCAEMLDAIKHAKDYISWGAPNHVVYKKIFDCMVKIPDDRPMFLDIVEKSKQSLGINLAEVFNPKNKDEVPSVYELVRGEMFKEYQEVFEQKLSEINGLREKVVERGRLGKVKFSEKLHFEEQDNVRATIQGNFPHEGGKVRRGVDITSGSLDWTLVASLEFDEFDLDAYNSKLQALASGEKDMYVYENGYRFVYSNGDFNLNIICVQEDGKTRVDFYFDNPIVPVRVFNEVSTFVYEICSVQPQQANEQFNVECIVYSKRDLSEVENVSPLGKGLYSLSTSITDVSEKVLDFAKGLLTREDKVDADELKAVTQQVFPESETV